MLMRLNAQAASHGLQSGHCAICRQQLGCLEGEDICKLLRSRKSWCVSHGWPFQIDEGLLKPINLHHRGCGVLVGGREVSQGCHMPGS